MGADSIIQAVVVTASGDIVTASACQNADLLWAIRGGGGDTFGVITELTVKAHPMPQATTLLLNVEKKTNCTSCWWDLMAEVHALLPDRKRQGLQGYYTIGGVSSFPAVTFYGVFFLYNKPNGTMEVISGPLLELLHGANDTAKTTSQVAWTPFWISVFDTLPSKDSAGDGGAASASRILPESSLTEDIKKLTLVLELIGPMEKHPRIAGSMTAGSVAIDNALNPAWRDTVAHLIAKESWKDSLAYTQANVTLDDMTNMKGAALRSLAPKSRTYFNEADALEPDWQRPFWSPNYERLLDIKHNYDPDGIFWCRKCVGSETWAEQLDGALCHAADGLLAMQY